MKSYCKKIAGVLGHKPHPYHRHWVFTYKEDPDVGFHAFLDNDDLEECPYKNQIRIVSSSVLLYIGKKDTTVDLYLPSKVTMIVIHKFGKKEPFCFATVGGRAQCSVYQGNKLDNNPHAKRVQ